MNRRPVLALAALTCTTTLLAGCGSTTVASAPAAPRTVSVSATGSADVSPDAAKATITVESTDPVSAQQAQEAAATATAAAIAALTGAGVAEADIGTQAINVGPVYNYTADGGQQLTGYRASQTLLVTLRDLATAGSTLDAVVAAGGNAVRIDALTPFVVDPAEATQAARAQAVQIATGQAEQYAELLGFDLGPVATVSEQASTAPFPPVAYAAEANAADKVPTPIQAGTTQVSVTIDIAWQITD